MADVQYDFSCSKCGRTFRGTEHSIRGLAARGGTCNYCRGPLVFPSNIALPTPVPQGTSGGGERLEQVDRAIARSAATETAQAWDAEIPTTLLQAEVISIVAAALFVDSWQYQPIYGLAFGFGLSLFFIVSAALYRILWQSGVPLFRGKGFILRAALGPLLLLVAVAALLSPVHRWLRRKFPRVSSPPVMAGTAAVCLSVVGALQMIHDPLRHLQPIVADARATAPASDERFAAGDVWRGKLLGSTDSQMAQLGLSESLPGLTGQDLSLEIASMKESRVDGQVRVSGSTVHVFGLTKDNAIAIVGDRMLGGPPVSDWPLGVPLAAAIDANGSLRTVGSGPQIELSLASAP
jgi:hypothetical protein